MSYDSALARAGSGRAPLRALASADLCTTSAAAVGAEPSVFGTILIGVSVWAIVLAAGNGGRFGGLKQFASLGEGTVADHTIRALKPHVDGICLVLPQHFDTQNWSGEVVDLVINGANSRAHSARKGFDCLPATATTVLVHDAARPFVSSRVIESVKAKLAEGAKAVTPVIAVVDSVRHVSDGALDRADYRFVQTPQGFDVSMLEELYRSQPVEPVNDAANNLLHGAPDDEASQVEKMGVDVVLVDGDPTNFKITVESDLLKARIFLNSSPEAIPQAAADLRIGHGFDVHRWLPGSSGLTLGGVFFEDIEDVESHSDGDVAVHAAIDALLSATGLGDIGQLFPETDQRLKGSSSLAMLRQTVQMLHADDWQIVNLDLTIICDRPNIAKARQDMIRKIVNVVQAPVHVKGKTTERIVALNSGPQCHAVALVKQC